MVLDRCYAARVAAYRASNSVVAAYSASGPALTGLCCYQSEASAATCNQCPNGTSTVQRGATSPSGLLRLMLADAMFADRLH